jgi:mannose-1-phosphate guanylyltransferase/mannose-6-phosphate isomerase
MTSKCPKIIVVILSGGSGSRLWPVSRENYPKPFIQLGDGQSLLQKAFLRGSLIPGVAEIITVTNRDHLFVTLDHYESLDDRNIKKEFILEPFGKNTAPAILAAALQIHQRHGPETMMLILPADQLVDDQIAFEKAVKDALKLASQEKLVTFGIKPHTPDTSFGYLEVEGSNVKRFVEKPNIDDAKKFIAEEHFFWNAGMFLFQIKTFLSEAKIHMSLLYKQLEETISSSIFQYPNRLFLNADFFKLVKSDSIDYALLEKSNAIAVVTCDLGWCDLGSWEALTDLLPSDAMGNRTSGKALLVNTENSSVYGSDRLVGMVGMQNAIVVETSDAVLVVNKRHAQEVKNLFTELKMMNDDRYAYHKKVYRPWGNFTVLIESPTFKVKHVFVKPGHELSLQKHRFRAEHWVVVKGIATVMNNGNKIMLKEDESTYISKGHVHQLLNEQTSMLEFIEVQSGEYLGEDDIERLSDKYERQP